MVQQLKQLLQTFPPLRIPTRNNKRILQTDASDTRWVALLLEEDSMGKGHLCGQASGHFSDAAQHYHSMGKLV